MNTLSTSPLNRALQFSQTRPLVSFAILTVAFSWLLWLLPWALGLNDPIAFRHLVAVGAFSPSLAGVVLTYLQAEQRPLIRWDWFMLAILVVGVLYILCLPYASSLPATVSNFGWAARILLWSAPALVIALSLSDQDQLRRLLLPAKSQKAVTAWYVAAPLFFPLIYGLSHLLSLASGDAAPITLNGGPAEIALTIAATFIYMALFGGAMGEEAGLRGFVLPRLQQKFSPLLSALLLSLAWSIWMLPLYFNGYYQVLLDGALEVLLFRAAANFFLVIILIWLYNRSGGSLLACILLHAGYTTAGVFLAPGWTAILVQAVAALALAAQAKMWQRLPEQNDKII